MFLKIATHLSFKPNFVNYMFKEDMISDGIENCVQYIHNFNPENPKTVCLFTKLFTTRSYENTEKKLEIKNKILEKTGYEQVFEKISDDLLQIIIQIKMLSILN